MTERQARILNVCLSSPSANISRSQIKRSVAAGLPSIIPDARVVMENFAIPKLGGIDIIAADKTGRTIFVNICETLDGAELCRILGLADWMVENGELIQNFHPGIRAGLDSKQVIFAGEADGGAKSALARMTKGAPEVFECNCAELGGETWIILQNFNIVRDKGDANLIKSSARAIPRREFNLKSVLTQEEIGEFFDRSDNDEVTSKYNLAHV